MSGTKIHQVVHRERNQAGNAFRESGGIADVEPAGIEGVAGEEDAGEPIEHCDAGGLMPRNRKDIELAAPEVVDTTVLRPASDAKERPDRRRIATDNRRARPTDKLTVTCDVIAVGVAVRDNKRDGGAPVPEEPCADESVDGVATSTRPAPVSSSKARSWPKTRYRNGFSKLVHAAWRRMKKPSLYACTRNGGVPLQAAPRRTSSPEADRAAAWKAGGACTQAPGLLRSRTECTTRGLEYVA